MPHGWDSEVTDLDEEEIDVLTALMTSPGESPLTVNARTLVAYCCGQQPVDMERRLVARATRDGVLRSRIRYAQGVLDRLRRSTMSAVASVAAGDGAEAEIAEAFQALMAERVTLASRLGNAAGVAWSRLRADVESGQADARMRVNLASAFVRELFSPLVVPGFAMARGGQTANTINVEGAQVVARVKVAQVEEGTLTVHATLLDENGQPATIIDGQSLWLCFRNNDRLLPIEESVVDGADGVWTVRDVDELLEIHDGPLPQTCLAFSLDSSATGHGPTWLTALVAGMAGGPDSLSVAIVDQPLFSGETCSVSILVPAETRRRARGLLLEIDLIVIEDTPIALGAFPIDEWTGDDVRVLIMPFAGIDADQRVTPSAFRLRIVPGAAV